MSGDRRPAQQGSSVRNRERSTACRDPWHFLHTKDGQIAWFRRLTPFAQHKHHYRLGPVPDDAYTVRIYGFGEDDVAWTCDGCGRVIDG